MLVVSNAFKVLELLPLFAHIPSREYIIFLHTMVVCEAILITQTVNAVLRLVPRLWIEIVACGANEAVMLKWSWSRLFVSKSVSHGRSVHKPSVVALLRSSVL